MKSITIAVLLSLSIVGYAAEEKTLAWKAPLTCVNGVEFGGIGCPPITRYRLHCATTSGGPYTWMWGTDAANTSDTRSYPEGEYYCVVQALNEVAWSDYSNEVYFNIAAPLAPAKPAAPIELVVVE